MECAELMKKLEIPLPRRQVVMQYKMGCEEYQEWRQLFYTDTGEFFTRSRKREDKESLYLFLYLSFAAELYDRYAQLNISDRIYFDTFSDIRIWYEHCVRERGVPGLVEEEWFTRHLNMRLFRLGRLQYETEGDALHVHIPEGSPLQGEACDVSFAQADRFFGKEYKIYDCESWLLDPVLTQFLPEGSNILRFQQRFRITKVRYDIPQAEERIFGAVLENKEDYPEKSSLQRRAKKYLMAGGKIGMGYGVIARRTENAGSMLYSAERITGAHINRE